MEFDHFTHIPRSKLDRLKDLYHAINIIKDCFKLLSQGNYFQVQTLYAKLRSLLTDNTTPPLLFEIEKILDKQLYIHYRPIRESQLEQMGNITIAIDFNSVSLKRISQNQERINLNEYLEKNVILYKNRYFKTKDIINALANQYGGAHYSHRTPKYLYEILSFGLNGQPMLNQYIHQFGNVVFQSGILLLKMKIDFDIYLQIHIPKQASSDEKILFDFTSLGTTDRLLFLCHQQTYKFVLIDCFGMRHQFPFDQIITSDKVHMINFSHEISDTYTSVFKIHLNEVLLVERRLEIPIFFLNEFNSYDVYINKTKDGEQQDHEFGFGSMFIYGKIRDHIEKLKMFNYFENNKNKEIKWIKPNWFGYRKANKNIINWYDETGTKNN